MLEAPERAELASALVGLYEVTRDPEALRLLGEVGGPEAFLFLYYQVQVEEEPVRLAAAIRALSRQGDRSTFPIFAARVLHRDPNVRITAVGALRRLADPRGYAIVRDIAESDRDPAVQRAAGWLGLEFKFDRNLRAVERGEFGLRASRKGPVFKLSGTFLFEPGEEEIDGIDLSTRPGYPQRTRNLTGTLSFGSVPRVRLRFESEGFMVETERSILVTSDRNDDGRFTPGDEFLFSGAVQDLKVEPVLWRSLGKFQTLYVGGSGVYSEGDSEGEVFVGTFVLIAEPKPWKPGVSSRPEAERPEIQEPPAPPGAPSGPTGRPAVAKDRDWRLLR